MEREELLKNAKALYEYHFTSDKLKHELEDAFPELKESEDERIRKEIIDFIEDNVAFPGGWISWLEKHKKQQQEWSEEDEVGLDATLWAINQARTVAKDENDMGACWYAEKWIKSLRPPLKDREMKLKILKYLSTRCSSLEFEEVEDYLNNLRPAYKSSEEQMNEPYNAAKIDTLFHPSLW